MLSTFMSAFCAYFGSCTACCRGVMGGAGEGRGGLETRPTSKDKQSQNKTRQDKTHTTRYTRQDKRNKQKQQDTTLEDLLFYWRQNLFVLLTSEFFVFFPIGTGFWMPTPKNQSPVKRYYLFLCFGTSQYHLCYQVVPVLSLLHSIIDGDHSERTYKFQLPAYDLPTLMRIRFG